MCPNMDVLTKVHFMILEAKQAWIVGTAQIFTAFICLSFCFFSPFFGYKRLVLADGSATLCAVYNTSERRTN